MTRTGRDRYNSAKAKKQREGSEARWSSKKVEREELIKFYGVNECQAIFRYRRNEIRRVFVDQRLVEKFQELLEWSERRGIQYKIVERDELSKIAATEHHEGICCEAKPLALVPLTKFIARLKDQDCRRVLILEEVENPHNVGAILRTAGFFGVSAVVLISKQLRALSGAACRVSEGAAEFLPITVAREASEMLTALKKSGFSVLATTPHQASSLYSIDWPEKVALIFGAEGGGSSEDVLNAADKRIVIPRNGPIESLNVGVAVACVLGEVSRVSSANNSPRQSRRTGR
jgi:TrmH RNA methyltransferase